MSWSNRTTFFHTYMWLRVDGTPYYVGKGSYQDRAYSAHRLNVGEPPPPDRIIIQEFPSEADALAAEVFLIAYYGRKDLGTGILINMTDGGEGTCGHIQTAEQIEKRTAQIRGENNPNFGKTWSAEVKQRMSEGRKGKGTGARAASVGQKISVARKALFASGAIKMHDQSGEKSYWFGKQMSAESNEKRRATQLGKRTGADNPAFGKHPTEETLAKMRASHWNNPPSWAGKHHSEETLAKMRASHAARRAQING